MSDYIITNYNKYQEYQRLLPNSKRKKRTAKRKSARLNLKSGKNLTRHYYLYALELEDSMYYIGVTSYKDATRRYEQHVAGTGARWTKLHKPIQILEVRDIGVCRQKTAIEAENLMTREYMNKYGIYKVRGGDLCFIKPALVALHFNDNGVKTILRDGNGRKIPKSTAHMQRVKRLQEQIADELSWIV